MKGITKQIKIKSMSLEVTFRLKELVVLRQMSQEITRWNEKIMESGEIPRCEDLTAVLGFLKVLTEPATETIKKEFTMELYDGEKKKQVLITTSGEREMYADNPANRETKRLEEDIFHDEGEMARPKGSNLPSA